MAKLDKLRNEVADRGIIPRREGSTGLPTEVYYLKVKELEELLADPSLTPSMVERARVRSKKRRRKKYIKQKALQDVFQTSSHSDRLSTIVEGAKSVTCCGGFRLDDYYVSETGFSRAKSGFVYDVDGTLIVLAPMESDRLWLEFSIPQVTTSYKGDVPIRDIVNKSEDRIYRQFF